MTYYSGTTYADTSSTQWVSTGTTTGTSYTDEVLIYQDRFDEGFQTGYQEAKLQEAKEHKTKMAKKNKNIRELKKEIEDLKRRMNKQSFKFKGFELRRK